MQLTIRHLRDTRYQALLLGAMGSLLLLATGAASVAEASCGDYVVVGNPAQHPGMMQHARMTSGATHSPPMPLGDFAHIEHASDSGSRPCHGPGCEQNRSAPRPPAPIVITISPELAAIPTAGGTAISVSGQSQIHLRSPSRVQGALRRVERPPQDFAKTSLGSRRASA